VLYEGLGLTLTSGPLTRVDVAAEFTWTQQARGTVDLTHYIVDGWPNEVYYPGVITSFTFTADQWPKNGAALGDGWIAEEATARAVYGLDVLNHEESSTVTMNWWDGAKTSVSFSLSYTFIVPPPGTINYGGRTTNQSSSTTWAYDEFGRQYVSSHNSSLSTETATLPLNHTEATLLAGYTAERPCTELVSFSLFADVQPILTDPEDGEAMRLDDIRSVNLSETIGEGTDAYLPIGDPRRRSYIATERGNQSLEHLIALARAHLMKRARVVEITFVPPLSRMPEITLRKNAFLVEPRVGEALGKIIGYSLALDGSDGRIKCEVRIGCAIGRGGSAVATGGEPTYASIDYTGADYQQFTGRTVLFDTSVGYQPPNASPNDDGVNFLSAVTTDDVIETGLVVENPPATQRSALIGGVSLWQSAFSMQVADPDPEMIQARKLGVDNVLKQYPTRATFKLKSMTRAFSTDYEVQVSDLKIATGYDLEAV
jgi:hypothetical protein